MNTITFDESKAKDVENAACNEFGFTVSDIVGLSDTFSKKVVVFILTKYFGFDKRNIGKAYQISYLYVPTVVAEIENQLRLVPVLELKINCLLFELGIDFKKSTNQ